MAWLATDDFDSYSDGNLNPNNAGNGWSDVWSSPADFTIQSSIYSSGTKAVKLTSSTGDKQASRPLTTAVTSGIFSVYMRKEAAEGVVATYLLDGGTTIGSHDVCSMGFASSTQPSGHGGEIFLSGTTTVQVAASYSLSTWYRMEIEIDGSGTQCRGRVDGGSWSSYVTMSNSKSQVSGVCLFKASSGTPHPDAYWDTVGGEYLYLTTSPDPNTETNTVDGHCDGAANATWAGARDITTSTANDSGTTLNVQNSRGGAGNYSVSRAFFLFNLSSLGSVTYTGAILSLFASSKVSNSGDETYDYVSIIACSPASNTAIASGDVDNILGTDGNIPLGATVAMREMHDSGERKDIDSISTSGYTSWTFNSTGVGRLSSGVVKFGAAIGFDVQNVAFTGGISTDEGVTFHSAENASGLTRAPKLTVFYTSGGVAGSAIFFGVNF